MKKMRYRTIGITQSLFIAGLGVDDTPESLSSTECSVRNSASSHKDSSNGGLGLRDIVARGAKCSRNIREKLSRYENT